jgi:hypothetical protein
MNSTSGWWTEIWSVGRGSSRVYCGVARTEEGFAVDLFRGDTCLESCEVQTRTEAVKMASALERRHSPEGRSPGVPARHEADALSW